jgi:hypothetical protein
MKDTYLESAQQEVFTEAKKASKVPVLDTTAQKKAISIAQEYFSNFWNTVTNDGADVPKNPKKLATILSKAALDFLLTSRGISPDHYEEFKEKLNDDVADLF